HVRRGGTRARVPQARRLQVAREQRADAGGPRARHARRDEHSQADCRRQVTPQGCKRRRSTTLSTTLRSARKASPTRSSSSAATAATAARFASSWFVSKSSLVYTADVTPRLIARS